MQELPKLLVQLHTKPAVQQSIKYRVKKSMRLMVDKADACELTVCKPKELKCITIFDSFFHKEWTESQDIHLWEKMLWTPRSFGIQWTV
eukprot:13487086-Ditylum_brightwellii.AAC.1